MDKLARIAERPAETAGVLEERAQHLKGRKDCARADPRTERFFPLRNFSLRY